MIDVDLPKSFKMTLILLLSLSFVDLFQKLKHAKATQGLLLLYGNIDR